MAWRLSLHVLSRTVLNCARIGSNVWSMLNNQALIWIVLDLIERQCKHRSALLERNISFQWPFYWLLPWLCSSQWPILSKEVNLPSIWHVRSAIDHSCNIEVLRYLESQASTTLLTSTPLSTSTKKSNASMPSEGNRTPCLHCASLFSPQFWTRTLSSTVMLRVVLVK